MPKQSFTPTGVEDKLTELYALTDPQLALQAADIEADPRTWLRANFNFTTDQNTFLSGMNDGFLQEVAMDCGLCFRNRLNIEVVYPAPPAPGMKKWTCPEETPKKKADALGNVVVSGSLIIGMQYTM